MNCPVCNNPAAKDITPHTFDGRSIQCPSCGEYDIVDPVYAPVLKGLEPGGRKDALARASLCAPLGNRPRITTYDL
jgi:hypothetical protein